MSAKKTIVIGTGPGGLTAAMILASHGYDVTVYEKQPYLGGRNSSVHLGEFTFDLGPTFLMMKHIVDEMFMLSDRDVADYLTMKEIDPLYRLQYSDGREFFPSRKDRQGTEAQIERLFPGNQAGYRKFFEHEKIKYERLVPCLQVPYEKYTDLLSGRIAKAANYLDVHTNLYRYLGRYFNSDDLKIAFTFQAKYLGMSPWECPATFSIISYLEHGLGIYHPIGGLNQIPKAMAKVVEEYGGKIHLDTGVKEVLVENGRATGVLLENGETVLADDVVLNADFAHAMTHLVDRKHLNKWTPETLEKKKYSCSTFMLYLGVDKVYDIPHHNILFSNDYKKNVDEIAVLKTLSEEPSIYIQNASITDPTLAPEGKSTIYILVPVANTTGSIDWSKEAGAFREKVLDIATTRGGLEDLRDHIEAEQMITPDDWQAQKLVYNGATFNLAHNIGQMLIWRPHNRFEEFDNCFLVGGGTHPGSGMPTIIESGRISAELMMKRDGISPRAVF